MKTLTTIIGIIFAIAIYTDHVPAVLAVMLLLAALISVVGLLIAFTAAPRSARPPRR